jgi:CO/xanthine dehydrogenase Mo-binding subunit
MLAAPVEALTARDGLVWPGSERGNALSYGEIVRRSGHRNLVESAVNRSPGGLDPETGQGVVTPHFFHAAAGAEVEVDLETGVVRVVDLHVETYAGKVVNPVLASLQCEGNVAFGIGQALFEEIELDGGQIVNPSLADYMIPSVRDMPGSWTVGIAEDPGEGRVHGLGETGAPPVPAAIGNALFHATGVRLTTLPLTPEKVLAALRDAGAARGAPAPVEAARGGKP